MNVICSPGLRLRTKMDFLASIFKTVLQTACAGGNLEVVKLLLNFYGDAGMNVRYC